ncbi:MAG: PKD domain-containing protein [Gemmatimonadetes bacterium]|nr:PKD domain-containing protein [Gemmatimonadota bacterium]
MGRARFDCNYADASPGLVDRGYLYSGGSFTDLGTLDPGALFGTCATLQPTAINQGSIVTGYGFTGGAEGTAGFRWENGTLTRLLPLPGTVGNYARDINDVGVIVGMGQLPATLTEPARWALGTWTNGVPTLLNTDFVGAVDVYATAINNSGTVLASAALPGSVTWTPIVVWVGGGVVLPGDFYATDIDDAGRVMGAYQGRPAIWQNGVITELFPSPAYTVTGSAYAFAGGSSGRVGVWANNIVQSSPFVVYGGGIVWSGGTPLHQVPLASCVDQAFFLECGMNNSGAIAGWDNSNPTGGTLWPAPANQAPTVAIGGPYSGNEGALIALSATGSDPDNQPLTYSWDFGDGSAVGSGAAPSHAFPDNGTYTVTVTVSDGTATATASTTVTASNVAPTGSPVVPSSIAPGSFAISLPATDPSPVDQAALTYRFNCGAGWGPVQPGNSTTCTLTTPGNYTIRLGVRDKDGGVTNYQRTITVVPTATAPIVTLSTPSTITIPVGGTATISGSFTDAPSSGPWIGRILWGQGQPSTSLGSVTPGSAIGASRTYTAAGTYTARLEVRNTPGLVGRVNVTVIVQ